ncbi:Protein transport protein sec20 [Marasmius tenuissimus]|uniref:Protein transport protein sec20 n=1 Tax=Marasmius tenuissimus TaxID=585030 RepID=A0ABR2ZJB0_9AGAR
MAPIPPKFDSEAIEIIESLERLERDIVEVQIPKLREGKGTLISEREEIRNDLDKLGRQLEELSLLVDDQTGEKSRRELRNVVDNKRERLRRLRQETRDVLLASKRTRDVNNREELLRSNTPTPTTKRGNNAGDDTLMEANNNVTESLRRVVGVMQGELEKSVLSVQMLETSTRTLESTSLAHNTLTFTLDTSKSLVTALSRADKWDRAVMIAAFVFFLLVVGLVVKERIFDKGMRIMFWWTRFIPDFSGDADLLKAGGGIVSGTIISVASSLASSTSLSSSTASAGSSLVETPTETTVSELLESTLATSTILEVDHTSHLEAQAADETAIPTPVDTQTTASVSSTEDSESTPLHQEL